MIYPDLYALLHSDPEAVRHFKDLPAQPRNSLENQPPAAGPQQPDPRPWETRQQKEG